MEKKNRSTSRAVQMVTESETLDGATFWSGHALIVVQKLAQCCRALMQQDGLGLDLSTAAIVLVGGG